MISFIVPAFNEEQNIALTVETIISACRESGVSDFEIILIDDGSADGTHAAMTAVAGRYPFIVPIQNPENMGLGSSVRRGLAAARSPQFMVVPGDNDMSQSLIVLLLAFREHAEIILTIPLNRESRSRVRNIISVIYQMIQMVTFNVYVAYINGPGIWPTEKAKSVGLVARRFSIISELNVLLLRSGCTYAEVPGYFLAKPKARRTVTWVNLAEVVRLFLSLAYRVHVSCKSQCSAQPRRIHIDFMAKEEGDRVHLQRSGAGR
jgi:glycosyltransferase involved in cell wall biosynthesis